jgi:GntR family transcriptional regulator/MocR family aminotransferase
VSNKRRMQSDLLSESSKRRSNRDALDRAPHASTATLLRVLACVDTDREAQLPLYMQITDAIRLATSAGDLQSGQQLPTTEILAAALGVSRKTIVTAYSRLRAEGLLTANTRRGTRIAAPNLAPVRTERHGASHIQLTECAGSSPTISYRARKLSDMSESTSYPDMLALDPLIEVRSSLKAELGKGFCRIGSATSDSRHESFREGVCVYLRHTRAVQCVPSQIVFVRNLNHAIGTVSTGFIDPGDCIYIDDPFDPQAHHLLRYAKASILRIPSDEEGSNIAKVNGPPPRLILVSPSLSIPIGRMMGEGRRLEVLRAAQRWDSLVLECDQGADLLYERRTPRSLYACDLDERVIYFGSLREILGANLGVGYLVAPPRLADSLSTIAGVKGFSPESLVLEAAANLVGTGQLPLYAQKIRAAYFERLTHLLALCKAHMRGADVIEPSGGLSVAIRFPHRIDEHAMCQLGMTHDLPLAPLSSFYIGAPANSENGLVIGWGSLSYQDLDSAIQSIAAAAAASAAKSNDFLSRQLR